MIPKIVQIAVDPYGHVVSALTDTGRILTFREDRLPMWRLVEEPDWEKLGLVKTEEGPEVIRKGNFKDYLNSQ